MPDRIRNREEWAEPVETEVLDADGFRLVEPAPQGHGEVVVDGGRRETVGRAERFEAYPADDVPQRTRMPGRHAGADEVADMLGAVDPAVAAEIGQATVNLVDALGDVRDEIDDAEAHRLAANRPRMVGAERRDYLPGPERQLLPGPELGPGLVPVQGRANLPELLGRPAYAVDEVRAGVPAPIQPRWFQVYDLPGFYQTAIRAMGRSIFSSFPCFRKQEANRRAAGEDPMGSIHLVANLQNGGPNTDAEVDQVARWIRANGVAVDANAMIFDAMPNYRPRIVLTCDERRSYLLVMEKREWGCPVDGSYVYSWEGGLEFYAGMGPQLTALRDVANGARPALVAMPAAPVRPGRHQPPRLPAARAPQAAPAARIPPQRVPLAPVVAERDTRDRKRLAALPVASSSVLTSDFTDGLSARGFKRTGTPEGPGLRKTLDDGRSVVVLAERGKSLATSSTYRLRVLDEANAVTLQEDGVTTLDEVDFASIPSFSPR